LELLFDDTQRALRGDEMAFQPLLPDDDATLEQRTGALSQWCQGFLYGFGTGQAIPAEQLSGDVVEIIKDLTYVARAALDASDASDASEEDEQSYVDLVEYLRVGVQLVHDELAGIREITMASPGTDSPYA
jgi:hypothetical protein